MDYFFDIVCIFIVSKKLCKKRLLVILLVGIGFEVVHNLQKFVIKGVYLFLKVLQVNFFVLVAGFNEISNYLVEIYCYLLHLLFVKLFMLRNESF